MGPLTNNPATFNDFSPMEKILHSPFKTAIDFNDVITLMEEAFAIMMRNSALQAILKTVLV
jgi:hypothetical protein